MPVFLSYYYKTSEKGKYLAEILQKLRAGTGSLPFAAVFEKGNRRELIITFLALLELMKKQEVLVRQPHLFGSIVIMLRNKA